MRIHIYFYFFLLLSTNILWSGMTNRDQQLLAFMDALQYGSFVIQDHGDDEGLHIVYAHVQDKERQYREPVDQIKETYREAIHLLDKSHLRLWPVCLPEAIVDRCFKFLLFINNDDLYDNFTNMLIAQKRLMHMRDTLIYEQTLVPQSIVRALEVIEKVRLYCEREAIVEHANADEIYQGLIKKIKENRFMLIKAIEKSDALLLDRSQRNMLHLSQVPNIEHITYNVSDSIEDISTAERKMRHQMRKERRFMRAQQKGCNEN